MRGIDELLDAVATLEGYVGDDDTLHDLAEEATAAELADFCQRFYLLISTYAVEEWIMALWPAVDSAKP